MSHKLCLTVASFMEQCNCFVQKDQTKAHRGQNAYYLKQPVFPTDPISRWIKAHLAGLAFNWLYNLFCCRSKLSSCHRMIPCMGCLLLNTRYYTDKRQSSFFLKMSSNCKNIINTWYHMAFRTVSWVHPRALLLHRLTKGLAIQKSLCNSFITEDI